MMWAQSWRISSSAASSLAVTIATRASASSGSDRSERRPSTIAGERGLAQRLRDRAGDVGRGGTGREAAHGAVGERDGDLPQRGCKLAHVALLVASAPTARPVSEDAPEYAPFRRCQGRHAPWRRTGACRAGASGGSICSKRKAGGARRRRRLGSGMHATLDLPDGRRIAYHRTRGARARGGVPRRLPLGHDRHQGELPRSLGEGARAGVPALRLYRARRLVRRLPRRHDRRTGPGRRRTRSSG